MRISIVTVCKNAETTIERTIKSVINQGYSDLEYIIIDGGSTDKTTDIIKKYSKHLRYWHSSTDKGMYDALNKGFSVASGDVLAWINSDDSYLPWTFRVVENIFEKFPHVKWITGKQSWWKDGMLSRVDPFATPQGIVKRGLACFDSGYRGIQQESTFWRKELWDGVGCFPPDITYAGDYWLWTKFANVAPLVAVDVVLGGFTVRAGQQSEVFWPNYRAEIAKIRLKLLGNLPRIWRRNWNLCRMLLCVVPVRQMKLSLIKVLLGIDCVEWDCLYYDGGGKWLEVKENVLLPIEKMKLL